MKQIRIRPAIPAMIVNGTIENYYVVLPYTIFYTWKKWRGQQDKYKLQYDNNMPCSITEYNDFIEYYDK